MEKLSDRLRNYAEDLISKTSLEAPLGITNQVPSFLCFKKYWSFHGENFEGYMNCLKELYKNFPEVRSVFEENNLAEYIEGEIHKDSGKSRKVC